LHYFPFEYCSIERYVAKETTTSGAVLSLEESRDPTGASTECVAMALREFRIKAFFLPGLGLSLPEYIYIAKESGCDEAESNSNPERSQETYIWSPSTKYSPRGVSSTPSSMLNHRSIQLDRTIFDF
jgi:hypothetical protein